VALNRRANRRPSLLQQLFSTFPQGVPGCGLLLLRMVVGAAAALQGWLHLANRAASLAETPIGLILALGGLSVLTGLLTPIGGAVIVLGAAAAWSQMPHSNFLDTPILLVFLAALAIAVSLLGPGWFSFDRMIFGRREIIIPRSTGQPGVK
jgi:hypothetical protein